MTLDSRWADRTIHRQVLWWRVSCRSAHASLSRLKHALRCGPSLLLTANSLLQTLDERQASGRPHDGRGDGEAQSVSPESGLSASHPRNQPRDADSSTRRAGAAAPRCPAIAATRLSESARRLLRLYKG